MKRHELLFGFLRVPLDIVCIFLAFFVARAIRMRTDLIPNIQLPLRNLDDTSALIVFAMVAATVCVGVFVFQGLYRIQISHSKIKEVFVLIHLTVLSFFVYIGLIYLANGIIYETQIPRLLIVFAFSLALVFMVFVRIFLNFVHNILLKKSILSPRNIILCLGSTSSDTLMSTLASSTIYNVIGYTSSISISDIESTHLGSISDIEEILSSQPCDEIFFLDMELSQQKKYEIFDIARTLGIAYKYIGNTFELSKKNTDIYLLGDIPLVEIHSVGLSNWGRITKRIFDIIVGCLLVFVLSPVMVFFGCIASIQSRATPLYTSKRIGKNGESFLMYKIRSMVAEAEVLKRDLEAKNERTDGPLFKIEKDPRITPIGRWIRRWDIDELPQLLNVIKGDMSLIGPRPHLAEEIDKYEFWQKRLLTIKPGITGMAQVNGRHTNTFTRECELDLFYIENWSLLLDLKILLKTVRTVVFGK